MSLRFFSLQLSVFSLLYTTCACGAEQKPFREQAQFNIYVGGKEIGREKFSIEVSGDAVSSSSSLSFRSPGNKGQNVKLETALDMDTGYVPRSYRLRSDIGGQKGSMKAVFSGGQASFEYVAGGNPMKSGLLVGDRFSILDTNVFHHFAFIARRFDLDSNEKTQSMEVVIPQELSNGILKVSSAGLEQTDLGGKKRELHHLKADSGTIQIDLWIDARHVLYKIALPAKGIEVIRN